ncbi:MAG: rhodanese-like domain-containing protein [Lachnospiraceae bacterium]|nr:rhodanese-like domain-containing protein [Lachnospiraceae bacterium]
MRFRNINIRNIMNEALNNEGIIVDVREKEDFAKGHIPMAINLPLSDIEDGKFALPKNKVILVYCENGGGSMMAARVLSNNGYNVINAVGGINNYRGAMTRKK